MVSGPKRQMDSGMGLSGPSFRVVWLAVLLLVWQSLAGGLALGTAASATQFDAFGNPLCLTSMGDGSTAPDGNDGRQIPDCCATGCAAAWAAVGPAPDAASWDAPLAFPAAAEDCDFAPDLRPTLHDGPSSPRAPPLTA